MMANGNRCMHSCRASAPPRQPARRACCAVQGVELLRALCLRCRDRDSAVQCEAYRALDRSHWPSLRAVLSAQQWAAAIDAGIGAAMPPAGAAAPPAGEQKARVRQAEATQAAARHLLCKILLGDDDDQEGEIVDDDLGAGASEGPDARTGSQGPASARHCRWLARLEGLLPPQGDSPALRALAAAYRDALRCVITPRMLRDAAHDWSQLS